ncbi:MAG: uracil phosphoribosyltransferase [Mollicutes bacterium]|nr:uracil phosphoribosyltransferase [Mollicutes bacterium]MDD7264241.1 uracil phosphoribosyltransferase [bacterium]MDY4980064.1 uracil phosphoribosyltransferase [Candidatus Onthovivens sp.]
MLHVVNHPLITMKLNLMRDEKTNSKDFRTLLDEISSLMTYDIFKDLHLVKCGTIKTPTGCEIDKLHLEYNIIVVPILRAGMGMSNGVINMLPNARIGHIGLYRNEETLEPVEYFFKMPKVENPLVLLCDPMVATGGSAIDAISNLKSKGFNNIRFLALVGAPVGVEKIMKAHPDVDIYIAAMDEKLNDKGYILPGLGDAGDRIFGTL